MPSRVIGTAVAGVTAKRLGGESGIGETMTLDALISRHQNGQLGLDAKSVVVVDEAGMEQPWRPKEDSNRFYGPIRLREALAHSRNLVSVRLMRAIGGALQLCFWYSHDFSSFRRKAE